MTIIHYVTIGFCNFVRLNATKIIAEEEDLRICKILK